MRRDTCATVISGGLLATTPGELAHMIGNVDILVWRHHEGQMDWCLCALDVEETLRRAGRSWTPSDNETFILSEQ